MDGKQIVYPDVMCDIDRLVVWCDGSESSSCSSTHRNLSVSSGLSREKPAGQQRRSLLPNYGWSTPSADCVWLVRCWQETGTQRNSLEHPAESPDPKNRNSPLDLTIVGLLASQTVVWSPLLQVFFVLPFCSQTGNNGPGRIATLVPSSPPPPPDC